MEALERIAEVRKTLDQAIVAALASVGEDGTSLDDVCEVLLALRDLKRDVAALDAEVEQAIIGMMDESIIVLPSGQQVEKRTGADRKAWDHKSLASVVADRVYESSIDMDTGEVLLSPKDMMTKMFEYAAPSYWRVGELNKIGISADAYCEKSEGKTSISISRK